MSKAKISGIADIVTQHLCCGFSFSDVWKSPNYNKFVPDAKVLVNKQDRDRGSSIWNVSNKECSIDKSRFLFVTTHRML